MTAAGPSFSLAASQRLPASIVSVRKPAWFPAGDSFLLREEASGREIPAQADPIDSERLYLEIEGLEAGNRRRFRLLDRAAGPLGAPGVEVSNDGSSLSIDVKGERFTRYHYAPADAPARPYFHPLLAPGGLPVTRGFPMADVSGEQRDHPHHRSVWVAHGDLNGADNWSEERGHARTEHLGFGGIFSGALAGGFRETTRWVRAEGEPLLDETRDVRAYATGPVRILDLTLRFTPAAGDVTFGDTKEGGLIAVRVATSMDADKGGTIHNGAGGVNEKETWGKAAPWCDYYGPVRGRTLGIALMDHPNNPRFPTYWHVRNYGLMTANPFGLSHYYNDKNRDGGMLLSAGTTCTWRYRLLVHPGTTEEADVAARYAAFAAPVEVAEEG